MIQLLNAPEMKQTSIQWTQAQPDKSRIKPGIRYANGNFVVNQCSKFDMYSGIGFDVDKHGQQIAPATAFPPFTSISMLDGQAFLLSVEEQLQQDAAGAICVIDAKLVAKRADRADMADAGSR